MYVGIVLVYLQDSVHRSSAQNQLLWIICLPHIVIFFVSTFKTLFGNYPWPSYKLWTAVCTCNY